MLLRVQAPSATGKASACLRRFTSGFLTGGESTITCADSGTLTFATYPPDPSPRLMTHLHFPSGGTIDSTN